MLYQINQIKKVKYKNTRLVENILECKAPTKT